MRIVWDGIWSEMVKNKINKYFEKKKLKRIELL
jgi:hypothetical protein